MATESEVTKAKEEIAHALVRAMIPHVRWNGRNDLDMAKEATFSQSENTRDALNLLLEVGFFGDELSSLYNHIASAINEYEGMF